MCPRGEDGRSITRDDHSLEPFWTAVCVLRCDKNKSSYYFLKNRLQSSRTKVISHLNHHIDNVKSSGFTSFWTCADSQNTNLKSVFATLIYSCRRRLIAFVISDGLRPISISTQKT